MAFEKFSSFMHGASTVVLMSKAMKSMADAGKICQQARAASDLEPSLGLWSQSAEMFQDLQEKVAAKIPAWRDNPGFAQGSSISAMVDASRFLCVYFAGAASGADQNAYLSKLCDRMLSRFDKAEGAFRFHALSKQTPGHVCVSVLDALAPAITHSVVSTGIRAKAVLAASQGGLREEEASFLAAEARRHVELAVSSVSKAKKASEAGEGGENSELGRAERASVSGRLECAQIYWLAGMKQDARNEIEISLMQSGPDKRGLLGKIVDETSPAFGNLPDFCLWLRQEVVPSIEERYGLKPNAAAMKP